MDDILNIDDIDFDNIVNMVTQIYPLDIQLNKAKTSDTDASVLDLHLFFSNDIVSTKIYDNYYDFDSETINLPF